MKKIIQVSILEKSIESLKYETNEKTASKALIAAAVSYQSNIDMIESRDIEISSLNRKLNDYECLIRELSASAFRVQSLINDFDSD